jgi:NNP family nitrate/nitrite transporter-like MFS transporter
MSVAANEQPSKDCWRVLIFSTIAFTLLFSVWLMLGVLSIPIKKSLSLGDSQVEWLIAAAILAGALPRMLFGIWADRYGGRVVYLGLLLFCAVPTYLMSRATTYPELLACTLLFGLAGNSFTAGISWNSAWFPDTVKGFALGVVGAGNVGASGTKLLVLFVPTILTIVPVAGLLGGVIPGGWRFIPALYSIALVVMALVIYFFTPVPDHKPGAGRPLSELMAPLRYPRVWRFSLYYVVVFGAYVALSGWLPKFYVDTYKLTLYKAALLTALFIFPASLLRPLGGWLSDLYGPRVVTYSVFLVMIVALTALCIPDGVYFGMTYRPGPGVFTALMFVVGCGMGIGKASVYKYVPDYFPDDVGAVGGLVGMLGALGGFFLPPIFGTLGRRSGIPQTAFVSLLVLTLWSLAWLHLTVLRIRSTRPEVTQVGRLRRMSEAAS